MNLIDSLEALLFVADAPAPVEALARALALTEGQVEQGLEALGGRLERSGALRLVRLAGGYQLATKPEHAEVIATFLQPARPRLGRSLLETLAIIAYRQPITLSEIETIRGVQSGHGVRALVERRLVQEVGRKKTPGRPALYGTTPEFLHGFGLGDLSELPPLEGEGVEALGGEASPTPQRPNASTSTLETQP